MRATAATTPGTGSNESTRNPAIDPATISNRASDSPIPWPSAFATASLSVQARKKVISSPISTRSRAVK